MSTDLNETRFDVVIVEYAVTPNRVVSIIGTNLSRDKAERRIETGVSRVNLDRAFVSMVPIGSHKAGDEYKGWEAK